MLTVVGPSPAIDITYVVDDYQLGEIHRPTTVARCAGGKALNMARAASRLGADVSLVAFLTGASGQWIAESLAAEGVSTTTIAGSAETRTCVSVASSATGSLTEVYEYASAITAQQWTTMSAALTQLLPQRPGWLSTSGSTPLGLDHDALAGLVTQGHQHGIKVALDTHGPGLRPALRAKVDLLKVNRSEAAAELGLDPTTDLLEMAAQLRDITGGLVVLTDGADGAVAVSDADAVRAQLPDIQGNFPVGSGDSFLGGLLAQLDHGADLSAALATAMACGTANALVPGAAIFPAETVADLVPQVLITRA